MNIPGKAVSTALILFGLGWLVTLFFNPNTWVTRSANQVNGTVQTGVAAQNFAPKNAAPLANGNKSTVGQTAIAPQTTQTQGVRQVPQTLSSPNQSVQASPSPAATVPAATVPATPQPTFEPAPTVVVSPSPAVVVEPVRAGW
jgi:hypothetical protein